MRKSILIAGASLVTAGALQDPVFAQAADGSAGVFQTGEIVVTAQKREESLQRVPAAVTAVTGETLAAAGVTDQSGLAKVAPGLLIGAQTGFAISFLRGVGQTQAAPNNPPAVAINLNGVYLPPESGFTPLYDMQRVEVLPGPQGTLYGVSAAGGVINFITKSPTKTYSADVNLEVGNYDAVKATGAVNIPLGSAFALRLAGLRQVHDPYLSNGLDDQDMWSGRATLKYDNGGRFTGSITAQKQHEGGTGNSAIAYTGKTPNPFYPDPTNLYKSLVPNEGQKYSFDSWVVTGDFEFELGKDLTLSYVPGFSTVKDHQKLFFLTVFPQTTFDHHVTQYTQELKLNGKNGSDDWIAGLYWLKAPNHYLDGEVPVLGGSIIENDLTSYAAFAEYRYRPTEDLTLMVGGRESHDSFKGRNFNSLPPFSPQAPQDVHPSDSRNRFDYKVGVNYQVAPRSMLYGVIQTGYIPSGFDQNGVNLKPSELTSYTVGSKNAFFENKLKANLELFYYDYKNFQLQFNDGLIFGSQSVPARIFGGELQVVLDPTHVDSLTFSALLQNAEMLEKTGRYVRNGLTSSENVSVDGYQLPYAPTATLRGSWRHTFPLANDQRLVAQVDVLYSSHYWESFTHDLYTDQNSYTKTDASLTYYSRDDRWSLGVFVRNAENQAVIIGSSKSLAPGLTGAPYLQAPRTYGVSLGANF